MLRILLKYFQYLFIIFWAIYLPFSSIFFQIWLVVLINETCNIYCHNFIATKYHGGYFIKLCLNRCDLCSGICRDVFMSAAYIAGCRDSCEVKKKKETWLTMPLFESSSALSNNNIYICLFHLMTSS